MNGFAKDVLPKWTKGIPQGDPKYEQVCQRCIAQMDIGYTSGGPKIRTGLQKMYCLNGYRVYLMGTHNMNRFARDVSPKWI